MSRASRSTTLVLGRPASHAASLARHHLTIAALTGLGAAAAGLGALATLTQLGMALALVALAGVLGAVSRQHLIRSAQARAGVRSERRVASVLTRLAPTVVINGADLGRGGDADHVVLGPVCAVIETKTGRGPVTFRGAECYVNGRRLPRNPCTQAERQARLLARRAHVTVTAVACVVDMVGPARQVGAVWLCSLADLPAVIHQLPSVLDASRARNLAAQLAPKADSPKAAQAPS